MIPKECTTFVRMLALRYSILINALLIRRSSSRFSIHRYVSFALISQCIRGVSCAVAVMTIFAVTGGFLIESDFLFLCVNNLSYEELY